MPLVSVWTAVLYFLASVSAPLFLLLQLLHFKTTLRFRVPLLSADLSVFRLQFFPLQLERLLGLRADPSALRLLSDVPEPPLGIIRRLLRFRFDSGAENHSVIILQDEFPHIIILWLRTEGHFADGQFSIVDTLKNTYPERIFKEYRQAYSHASLPTHIVFQYRISYISITLLMNDPWQSQ